ncbi:hypothetical protein GCM10027046_09740 [Uliginosibacterium flavum]|uniref:Plasmid stabilization protein n=1 Tax=Uliginosibacterium flavum TaxID=1396831 RepID=A0ABV2TJJ0_9RHOO
MPQSSWNPQRVRQYAHIKDSLLARGETEKLAEDIAARTVNKERARHGEAEHVSASSINDISSGQRGGQRSHTGPDGRTLAQLHNEARQRGVKGRYQMSKAQLKRALLP